VVEKEVVSKTKKVLFYCCVLTDLLNYVRDLGNFETIWLYNLPSLMSS